MAKRKRNLDEIRDELIELRVDKGPDKDFIEDSVELERKTFDDEDIGEGDVESLTGMSWQIYVEGDVQDYNKKELYREAKKEGIEIYEPKITKRKGDRLM